jgi:hypothetical protein
LLAARGTTDLDGKAASLGDKKSSAVVVAADGDLALVHLRTDAHALRRKIERYRDHDTASGQPSNAPLVARIDNLRTPTLADLSLGEIDEGTIDPSATYWVELWARGGWSEPAAERTRVANEVRWLARLGGQASQPARFDGVERDIYLARLSGETLLAVAGLVPEIYEVHFAPRVRLVEAAIQAQTFAQPPAAVADPPDDAAVVAVHDTGTSPEHPYLQNAVIGLGSVVPGEPEPTDRHGHGTEMSGVATYRDYLQELLADLDHPDLPFRGFVVPGNREASSRKRRQSAWQSRSWRANARCSAPRLPSPPIPAPITAAERSNPTSRSRSDASTTADPWRMRHRGVSSGPAAHRGLDAPLHTSSRMSWNTATSSRTT